MPDRRQVAVTGLGALSPGGGNTANDAWQAVVAGKSGIAALSRFDSSQFSVHISGEVSDFNVSDYISEKKARQMDLFIHYGIAAAMQAVADAGLTAEEPDCERIGIAIGSGIGGLRMIEQVQDIYRKSGPRRISPFFIPATIINMIAGHVSIFYKFLGPNISMVSACTTGAHNIGDAYRMICYGDADVMVCGGAEAAITPLGLGSFASARALTKDYVDEPTQASRPFDAKRSGFVLGEGAGVLVLEEYERAKARGAKIYAMMTGYGMSADGHHMTAPPEDGNGAARAMKNAMRDAQLPADEVDYINAHGTSTPLGDIAETRAIRLALENAADKVMVSSTKSMTGHLLGAAGGIEAVFSVLALHEQIIPPTINLEFPDPACDLDYVPQTARQTPVRNVLSNSFGFGGTNATLAFGAA
ncbi:MAG: beta-ketoacyl-ACP synthase II [Gammaproteobacteria bacterium WSBS_2016_MAG_OTU1]